MRSTKALMQGDTSPQTPTPSGEGEEGVLPTRERILREAQILFQKSGFTSTTMRSIAAATGLTPGALYWHFPSKEATLYAILLTQSEIFDKTLEPARMASTPREKLLLLIKAFVEWQVLRYHSQPRPATIPFDLNHLIQALNPEQREHIQNLIQAHQDMLTQVVADGIADGTFFPVDPKVAGYAIRNMCGFVVTWWSSDDPYTPEDLVTAHQQLALRMLTSHAA